MEGKTGNLNVENRRVLNKVYLVRDAVAKAGHPSMRYPLGIGQRKAIKIGVGLSPGDRRLLSASALSLPKADKTRHGG